MKNALPHHKVEQSALDSLNFTDNALVSQHQESYADLPVQALGGAA